MEKNKELKKYEENNQCEIVHLVAVYGSLRKTMGNHGYLRNSTAENKEIRFLGQHKTEPKYTMYSLGGFPGVVEGGTTAITYELYGITNENPDVIMGRLNSLEGYRGEEYNDPRGSMSNMYNRKMIETPYGPAILYIYNCSENPSDDYIVKSGDWVNYYNDKWNDYRNTIRKKQEKVEVNFDD